MREESSSTALVVSALAPLVIDQVTSLRERGVTECILSGHAGVSKELLVTASDVSKRLVLWRLLLEYINLIILRRFYGILCACANSVYEAIFFGLGTHMYLLGMMYVIHIPPCTLSGRRLSTIILYPRQLVGCYGS